MRVVGLIAITPCQCTSANSDRDVRTNDAASASGSSALMIECPMNFAAVPVAANGPYFAGA